MNVDGLHLTYCTNIHPADGFDEVRAKLEGYLPALKRRLASDGRFGIGLRLSNAEAEAVLEGRALEDFRGFLDARDAYVFTINGFPYGAFHGESVKDDVHTPDWRTDERADYTKRLADILAKLAPDGVEPGISTNPLTYRRWEGVDDDPALRAMTANLAEVVAHLARLHRVNDQLIHIDIEPEPDGLIETSAEFVDFFETWLLGEGAERLADELGESVSRAEERMRRHVRVCLDTCHAAVMWENPADIVERFDEAGIQVGKVQVSSALDVRLTDDPGQRDRMARALEPFDEPVYLHQVVQKNRDGSFDRYPDLGAALSEIRDPEARRWRIHFHVPIFRDEFADFGSTQSTISEAFEVLAERSFTRQLEIETYTWDVLPEAYRTSLLDSIEREYEWVIDELD